MSRSGMNKYFCDTTEASFTQDMPLSSTDGMVVSVPKLDEFGALMAFSLRKGGVSPAPFDSLNLSDEQGDSAENARHNFQLLAKRLGLESDFMVTCKQVHGDCIALVDAIPAAPPEADAIITTTAGIYPGVKVADCLPILIVDSVRRVAAAVHAGRRGTFLKITTKVIQTLKSQFGCRPSDLVVGLGPAIGKCCYACDDAVLAPFRESFPEADRFISNEIRNRDGSRRFFLDLKGANLFELTLLGVPEENIVSVDLCTSCRPDLLFSHRRDGAATGRQIGISGFRP
jgi:polyphenol oxidase